MHLSQSKIKELELRANDMREELMEVLVEAGSGHSAGPLGMADIFSAFYFHILSHDPKNPEWEDRDRLVLSNGHICPIQYVSLANAGYFDKEELFTLRKIDSRLQGHPHRGSLPGIETTSGPLGSGLSQAIGIAVAAKLNQKRYRVYCLASDGEHNEGNWWEAVMLAAKMRINNLTVVVDRNNIQIDGYTEDVMPLESLRDKYEAFNWQVLEIDGHKIEAIVDAVNEAKATLEAPTVVIAHTIPGKGVSFMEGQYGWHGKPPKPEEAEEALKELRSLEGKIRGEHA
ncbi:MAG: transketolase [Candidatus Harrisonbacteria bacterium CG10_big_fil_rev_8_21_14_0_10_44_23]|uniref:Transketolase n=1 Tax=Candidatus Harrisonbacteria bacterium CG10_big_fil_rev_8_21_14_0_10_44_23 TaxID=1974585 RepID=A0A2H0UQ83_9BACT|nr:MAG: transketolase [Candidatus Harrisonbacteria bacterium CG10_big_fil_rev_8_21_14_0_10_44_23]